MNYNIKINNNKIKINEDIIYIENNYLYLKNLKYKIKESYNIIDAMRDYFKDQPELCNHNNLQDQQYISNMCSEIKKDIEFSLFLENKNVFISFLSPVLIYDMNNYEKQCKDFVLCSENNKVFEIYSFSENKKGSLIFKKENVNNSFFDLYDYFDLIYILLCSIKKEIGYEYKHQTQEEVRDFFIEF